MVERRFIIENSSALRIEWIAIGNWMPMVVALGIPNDLTAQHCSLALLGNIFVVLFQNRRKKATRWVSPRGTRSWWSSCYLDLVHSTKFCVPLSARDSLWEKIYWVVAVCQCRPAERPSTFDAENPALKLLSSIHSIPKKKHILGLGTGNDTLN